MTQKEIYQTFQWNRIGNSPESTLGPTAKDTNLFIDKCGTITEIIFVSQNCLFVKWINKRPKKMWKKEKQTNEKKQYKAANVKNNNSIVDKNRSISFLEKCDYGCAVTQSQQQSTLARCAVAVMYCVRMSGRTCVRLCLSCRY